MSTVKKLISLLEETIDDSSICLLTRFDIGSPRIVTHLSKTSTLTLSRASESIMSF
jgi:hypothetical protein